MDIFTIIEEKIDSALSKKEDSITFYSEIIAKMVHLSPAQRISLISKAEKLNEQDTIGLGNLALIKGMRSIFEADFYKALEELLLAKDYFDVSDAYGGRMSTENLLSVCFRSIGQLEKSQVHMQSAMKALEKVERGNPYWYFLPVTFYQAGELSVHTKNYDAARDYYEKGMQFVDDNPELKGRLLSGTGNLLMLTEHWEQALDYFTKAVSIIEKSDNYLLQSKLFADIGNFYLKNGDHQKALENQNRSLELRLAKNLINPAVTNYIQLAEIHLLLDNVEEAIRYGNLAVENSIKLKTLIKLYEAHYILSRAYEKAGQPENAFEHFKQYHKHKEEVHNSETVKKIEQLQNNHKVEIVAQEKEIFRLRNVELKFALDEITDSFRYARRIQTSLLPTEIYIEKTLKRLRNNKS
ncbi:MAG: tetratricopeptide repeat protein [Bacteroidia bacterium]|nr:tetratricopeptide repeat protein [Bacteroidia bacterium]